MPNGGAETPTHGDDRESGHAENPISDGEDTAQSADIDQTSQTGVVATGLPPSIETVRDSLTPMLSQYAEICAHYDDALVLFQVGDFYEAFCEAAEEVARICEVALTQRQDSTGEYPMAGIPIDSAASYLEALLDAGYRVAVADQIEQADESSGLVDRAVTQVITPGTIVEDELLSASSVNYVAALARDGLSDERPAVNTADRPTSMEDTETVGLAAVDVSTGECLVTSGDAKTIREELERLNPAEVLRGPAAPQITPAEISPMESAHDSSCFQIENAHTRLESYVSAPGRRFATNSELRACGAVLAYAEYTQGDDGPLEYISRIRRYDPRDHLRLDAAALQSLEIFENRGLGASDTLFASVDQTACAMGRRCLERWLRRPSIDLTTIRGRHDAIAELVERSLDRERLAELLATAYDLERLVGRISRGRANARDLRSLHATLGVVPEVRDVVSLDGEGTTDSERLPEHMRDLIERLDPLDELRDLIEQAIRPDPPQEITDGGLIRTGYDDKLDELRTTEREGREWVAALETDERDRTGIDSLTVGHNEVHGYYIEVTDANLDRVPDDYQRRQTLKNAERYCTPGLKQREDEILGASERADALEYDLFTELRDATAAEVDRIQALADALAELDALRSLATVAVEHNYTKPDMLKKSGEPAETVVDERGITLERFRHPVVERHTEFVPNDARFPPGVLTIITGPNMSGKSTYMRAVAVGIVLAQAGGFVPAETARLPIVDRIFTRVGASDDIAGGQSTFMREMAELSEILHDAGPESLVLLDEVGRGTSTADGRALARAAAEFVHDTLAATTLFATHYHELTALANERDRVTNLHFGATRNSGDVTFLHRVSAGAADESYGIEVAEMAGVPETVVSRARELVTAGAPGASGADEADESPGSLSDSVSDGRKDESASPKRRMGSHEDSDGNSHKHTNEKKSNDADRDKPEDGDTLGDNHSDKTGENRQDIDSSRETETDPDRGETTPRRGTAGRSRPETRVNGDSSSQMLEGVVETVADIDLATMTPIEALNTLHELQKEIDD